MGPRLRNSFQYRPPSVRHDSVGTSTNHDESGQVYTELTCAGTSMTADWKWKTKGSTREYGRFRSMGPGCSSLYKMAIRSCLRHSRDITAETLEEVPESIGVALWNRLVTTQLDSIQLFLAFSSSYPSKIQHKYYVIPNPTLQLSSYLTALTSSAYQWLTNITLLDITIPRTALIQLSLVSNLAVLTIGPSVFAPDIGVDDSLIRTWSRSASTGAFSVLRVLALRRQLHLTTRAFEYLSAFPALTIFATESMPGIGPKEKPDALALGWKYRTGKDLSDWLIEGSGTNTAHWDAIAQALMKLGGKLDEKALTAEAVAAVDVLPVVHLALGGYAEDAAVGIDGEEAMRVWHRLGKLAAQPTQLPLPNWGSSGVRMEPRELSTQENLATPPKRALDSGKGSVTRKKFKPVMRTGRERGMGEFLSEFGT